MPRDSFKKNLQHKSKVENFADCLESLFRSMRRCGVDPMEVTGAVVKREHDRELEALRKQTAKPIKWSTGPFKLKKGSNKLKKGSNIFRIKPFEEK